MLMALVAPAVVITLPVVLLVVTCLLERVEATVVPRRVPRPAVATPARDRRPTTTRPS